MTNNEFKKLKAGDHVVDLDLNVEGEVKSGKWKNWGTGYSGDGLYIVWFDGDNSQVGMNLHNSDEISDMIKILTVS